LAQAAYQYLANAYPELEGLELSITKPFDFKARDGLMIPGYLTVPKGAEAKNLPLIVHPHGGPRTRDFLDYDYWVQFFASRGWAVFQPNFRGSSGYGAGLEAAGLGEWGRAMQDDLTDGVQALISEGVADPDRICIVGSSYGGYASLQGLVKTPDLYACGVAVNPVTDIAEIISDRRHYTGFLRWRDYWRQDDMAAVSPARHAEKITAPVMIAYSEDDRVVEPDHSTMMIDALKDADGKVEKVRLKDGDHSLSRHQNRVKLFQKMDAFLQAQIGLGPIPSGASD
ncbi:MAG: prolyl oligopeptidase family serine peptidase, partial [Alphaproteobacteria bacterium]|nr:prolyl oligopeptidase family serine peptidase [Alphaproteobacteria bacterium]